MSQLDLQYKSKEEQYKLYIEEKQIKRKKREADRAKRKQKGLHAFEVITAANLQREAEKAQRVFERQSTLQEVTKEAKVKKVKKEVTEGESELLVAFATEKNIRDNESGIRRYFLYDMNNPIDMEIVQRIEQYDHLSQYAGQQEQNCRRILQKRLRYRTNGQKNTDQVIEMKLLQRCNQRGITRTEYVRELFCVHFNIKTVEVGNPQSQSIPDLTQKDLSTMVSTALL